MNRQDYDREQESRDALASKLRNYAAGPWYPMHMPGHKRRLSSVPGLPVSLDFTEVPGTDDLHHPESILKAAMERTARTVGADRTWYLVNGSTAGNLAAVFALAPYHGELIVAGNCHRSVYHGLELRDVHPHFIDPVMDPEYGIPTVIRPEDVEEAFRKYPESSGVILTSPTYEGVVSDIRSIAEICHRHGGLLFVDEAHGAHFGLVEEADFPESAIRCGADLSVQSAHKTLLGLTQTAFLHCRGKRIDQEAIQRALDMFESSSPSYPLLMSLDGCTDWLLREGKKCFCAWRDHLHALDQTL
ncbi:MAG TPA: ornithine decarboxylase, partial [Oribacterium sp.]|nr:ornithine decarboxylase [Oribacterium sp.]